ncbi:uncharacterized protein LOC126671124 [Mercurialis annua]|uniref:uncharacterized protein LOC126671124 n=1 Tax=Mercurialis annua TaxID=3986 RepID=UPI0024AC92A6|nr:uncharacterized protein LOC126671124 [Mercurialis annua]
MLMDKVDFLKFSQQWTVAAKIISQRRFNILVIRNTIQQSWRLRGEFAMARFPDNVFTIRFDNQLDYKRVLEERPWNIQNHHFNIQEWPNDIPLSKINFDESLFWVHVNGLPPNLITKENGKMIGELFSGFVEVDLNEFAPLWRQHFLRIRVRVNNTEPFKTGFHNVTDAGGTEWIYFTYEKLPDICYFCGCMGHTVKFCLKRIDEETEGKVFMGSLMYGPQLRTAAMMHSSKLSLVRARTRYYQATQQREQSQVPEMQSSSPTPAPPMGNSSQTYVVSMADNEVPVVVSVGTNYLSRIISTTEVDVTMLSNLEQWRVSDIMQSNIPAMYGATEPIFSTLTQTGIHNLLEPMSPFSCPSLTELSPVREWRLPPNMVNALSPRVQTEYRQLSPMVTVGQDLQSDILVDYLYASGYIGSNEGGISSVDLAEIRELLSDIYRGGPIPIIAPPQQTEQQAEPTVPTSETQATVAEPKKKRGRPAKKKTEDTRGTALEPKKTKRGKRKLQTTDFAHQYAPMEDFCDQVVPDLPLLIHADEESGDSFHAMFEPGVRGYMLDQGVATDINSTSEEELLLFEKGYEADLEGPPEPK